MHESENSKSYEKPSHKLFSLLKVHPDLHDKQASAPYLSQLAQDL